MLGVSELVFLVCALQTSDTDIKILEERIISSSSESIETELERPVFVSDVVEIPSTGTISAVEGDVSITYPGNSYVLAKELDRITHNTRITIPQGSLLKIVCGGTQCVEFYPAPKTRNIFIEVKDIRPDRDAEGE